MPDAPAEHHAYGQVGGYTPGKLHTLGAITVPRPHPTAPRNISASFPPATSSLSSSAPAASASKSRRRLPRWKTHISREGGKCAFINHKGKACTATSSLRHWTTTHALKEAKGMLDGTIPRFQGGVIQTEQAFKIAEEYLPYCRLPWCRRALFPRRRSLEVHVQTCLEKQRQAVGYLGPETTLEDAMEIVEDWMPGGNHAENEGWKRLIGKLCALERSRAE